MSDYTGPTIQEMRATRDKLRAGEDIGYEALVRKHAAAVTAAERLAKALAGLHKANGEYFAQRPGLGLDAPPDGDLSVAETEARATLDELWPNWREEA